MSQDLNLLDAIKIAMEAERKAAAFYADAAKKTSSVGRGLLNQLAELEQHHYDILAELEESLRDQGAFIEYEGKELLVLTPSEAQTAEEPDKMSMMGVITLALDIEREARRRYETLAEKTSDPSGKAMFERLAKEEQKHYVILSDAYWSLNDHGVWVWPKE
jgi:rubrerythrin